MITINFPLQAREQAVADVTDLMTKFREKFFIASQMTREERIARKGIFPRDKRGQGLGFRLTTEAKGVQESGVTYDSEGAREKQSGVAQDDSNNKERSREPSPCTGLH